MLTPISECPSFLAWPRPGRVQVEAERPTTKRKEHDEMMSERNSWVGTPAVLLLAALMTCLLIVARPAAAYPPPMLGDVSAWGDGGQGQLGNGISGTGVTSSTPVQVSSLSGIQAIACGGCHSLA